MAGVTSLSAWDGDLVVVQDDHLSCPYLPEQTARMPLRMTRGVVVDELTDWILAAGYRRSGEFVYRTECPHCQACQPTRVLVPKFGWTKSLRRVLARGDRHLSVTWSEPSVSGRRVDLFNQHRMIRGLATSDRQMSHFDYQCFLATTFGKAEELAIWLDDKLIGIAITDIGVRCLSAVYTFFDSEYSRFSLGTYAILKQVQRAEENKMDFVYLGMYVRSNSHLNYKSRFLPQERLIEGQWVPFGSRET